MPISEQAIQEVAKLYPGCPVIRIPEDAPTEVIFEVSKAPDGKWSTAIALIESSVEHQHDRTLETYKVLQGGVHLTFKRRQGGFTNFRELRASSYKAFEDVPSMDILPGWAHSAKSLDPENPAMVLVVSTPAWTPEDHHLVKPEEEK